MYIDKIFFPQMGLVEGLVSLMVVTFVCVGGLCLQTQSFALIQSWQRSLRCWVSALQGAPLVSPPLHGSLS